MIKVGVFNELEVLRIVDFGAYLDDGEDGILLPIRWVPENLAIGDFINVFIYHDNDSRLIATTLQPKGKIGDIVNLKVVTTTEHGAYLDNGLMKDIFVPLSQQYKRMLVGESYLVRIFIDGQTGRMAATEKIKPFLSNENLTVKEKDEFDGLVYRNTDLGFEIIINQMHLGLLYHDEIYRKIEEGDSFKGFIKKIYPNNKIDVAIGKVGYNRVEDELEKILRLLNENNGFLAFNDKSDPNDIYDFFAMSKKTFKMAIGSLYKQRKIAFEKNGIQLLQ
jgi:predicted RNA-binding protein (virulence factor B family)